MSDLIPGTRSGRKRHWGLALLGVVSGAGLALSLGAAPFVAPALRRVCLPFVPASPAQVETVLQMLKGRRGKLVDIGSGDGRIVIAAAKQGFRAVGYELNPWLVWYSRYKAWQEGVHHNTRFYISDLWKMTSLEEKLQRELRSNARVVACRFPFPSWMAVCESGKGIDTAWLYDAKSFKTPSKEIVKTIERTKQA
ncbi:ATP synthase subunit C lysine N-methyltransferase isoform X2 [Rhincodon typus]|uniref:ATP synthase subunit C lysine N-methyltransferase isoform X2 n=1 Tax=Rhincodon typus TaxID=259920 RepID=UPI0020306DE1|nr:ATP synthase subunit C lysine N-methyltransferase isoform X2 [Rhincodon typus]